MDLLTKTLQTSMLETAIDLILEEEGGFVDHPRDPGGATKYGITIATLENWRGRRLDVKDVIALTKEEARDIYKEKYWDKVRCGEMPMGLALMLFDCAVNQGVSAAARLLQESVGASSDGVIGPKTMDSMRRAWSRDAESVVLEFAARRMVRYGDLSTFETFGLGWSRRLMRITARSLQLTKTGRAS